MFRTTRRTLTGLAALGALALGGSALAGAATRTTTPSAPTAAATAPAGRHVGADGRREQALGAGPAAKVKAAAEAKVPGGTVLRVETDVDTGSPYEAHVQKADGSQVVVYVNDAFKVTSVAAFGGAGGAPGPARGSTAVLPAPSYSG